MAPRPHHPSQTTGLPHALADASADKRLDVLRHVAAGCSISQAARQVGISYKAAWQALDTLSNLSGEPLVERIVGGVGGGGARITAEGLRLLALAAELARARQQVLARDPELKHRISILRHRVLTHAFEEAGYALDLSRRVIKRSFVQ